MPNDLKQEFDWYLKNQADLVKQYNGRVIAIKGCAVLGDYPTEAEAISETAKTESLGTFLVQRVTPDDSAYTATFHSRVSFAR